MDFAAPSAEISHLAPRLEAARLRHYKLIQDITKGPATPL
ncbi:hypothetical protein EIO_1758 [Ketogulonicigenium vulgare Y25]|uniref:Uncharacterized protein n=1 Tax=Ketogulonicigenium vulgare (strain WSH-001) TaxID=759362 RepID=F9Y7D4_KETVW|nr:hypothetical protein EIO_1758 [Ketogulonicigenium vulgare Y25]AEM41062.1 hypothetical protein KVU_1223 [Ketogulonicigenium vulgare WSH-001]ALJ82335.1 hypothetical protein KVH_08465 [Ketogulonicigenium vulgare]ANW35061.1 hypothetical protein KvSKV_08435 [Ketogulonicigenium vulgare]AOZ54789.1 hypothetical protein KVC_1776 [Ketogulonicigenium vulgare]